MDTVNTEINVLVNNIDELLCLKTLKELRKIATKIRVSCKLTNK